MTFSEKLVQLRKEKGLSQEDLAELCGVSRQAVSRWELGTSLPDMEKLLLLGNYFSVSMDYLLREEETRKTAEAAVEGVYIYSFEKICRLLLPRREKMETLYDNAGLYDVTYDTEQDNRVEEYWKKVLAGVCDVKRVLDCSIGTGQMTLALAKMGYQVTGTDISAAMLANCRENAVERGLDVTVRQCDFRKLSSGFEAGETFDCVMSTGNSLPHVTNEEVAQTLREMDKLVRPGGYLYLDNRNWDKILREHQRFYFYQPMKGKTGERINLTQVWDYNLDGTLTFHLLYTFERDGRLYKKEVSSIYSYPLPRKFLEQQLEELGYRLLKEEPRLKLPGQDLESTDWYYMLAQKLNAWE